MFDHVRDRVRVVEVGPRDGLQNEKKLVSTQDKEAFVQLLIQAGFHSIELTSFVKASAIPQMADAQELFSLFSSETKAQFPCLVPNMKGFETARDLGVKEIALFTASSESFNQKNIRASIEESLLRMEAVIQEAKKEGIRIRGYVSTAFYCPYEGKTSTKKLIELSEWFLERGIYEVSIGDTIGAAGPKEVWNVLEEMKQSIPVDRLAMHFHDTRGMAIANILTSLEQGIRVFDSSAGGLGGCPYAKGATGNVASEDLIYLLDKLGMEHGIKMEALIEASTFILKCIGKESTSKVYQTFSGDLDYV
ncbi:MAG: hydroxymethylglutaryl-CoA lyase [Waddliaceae bacterium]|nr:hydroxymethylglutaryl-CoA lyase [Waddliaceae bacterium]